VAAEDVDHLDQPARQRAELLSAGADAAVHRASRRRGELAGDAADGRCVDAARRRDAFRREVGEQRAHLVHPADVRREAAEVDQVLVEQRVRHGGEQEGVAAGTDEEMLVGVLGRLGAARVDDHHLAAPFADGAQPSRHVRRGHQRAVAGVGVGAEDDQVVGTVEVGHGQVRAGAEHQRAAHLLGHLVDGAGGEEHPRSQRGEERAHVEHQREAVRVGVAEVHGDGVAAVLRDDPAQPLLHRRERLVPRAFLEAPVAAQHRGAKAVGVVVEVGEGDALGADEAMAEDVGLVAAHPEAAACLAIQGQPAGRLAERADHPRRAVHRHGRLPPYGAPIIGADPGGER